MDIADLQRLEVSSTHKTSRDNRCCLPIMTIAATINPVFK